MSAAKERRAFAEGFAEEPLEVFLFTGEGWFDGRKHPWERLYRASMPAAAWKRVGTEEIHRGEFLLQALVDERTLHVLEGRCPGESLVKTRVRLSPDGKKLMVLDMPEPAQDPAMLRLLSEQTGRSLYEVPELGPFLQTNADGIRYVRRLDWLGRTIPVELLGGSAEDLARASETLCTLFSDQGRWDARIGMLAVREYREYAQQICEETGETKSPLCDAAAALPVCALEVGPGDSFIFLLDGGTLLGGHDMRVECSISGGPRNVCLYG